MHEMSIAVELIRQLEALAAEQLKVSETVKTAYYEIYFQQQAIGIVEELRDLVRDQYIGWTEDRLLEPQGSQQDLQRAQLELEKLRERLIRLRSEATP